MSKCVFFFLKFEMKCLCYADFQSTHLFSVCFKHVLYNAIVVLFNMRNTINLVAV